MNISISLVINSLNEEDNIAGCIISAQKLVNEIIIVDMQSEDKTVEIAKSLGATVYSIERQPFVDPTRNFALSKTNSEWILLLDADERLTSELASELRRIAQNDEADVVRIKFDTFMFGQKIRYSGWQEDSHDRFFKKAFFKYSNQEVHSKPEIRGRHLILDESKGRILHYNYRDFSHFIEKLSSYTEGEALKLLRSNTKVTPLRGAYWGFRHFLKRYFCLKGYKDGKYGFILSVFMGFYWFCACSKAWEKKQEN